jgi:hypothetical protein
MNLSPFMSGTNWPVALDVYGAFGGMRIGRGNRSTHKNPVPVPIRPPQIPHDLTWDRPQTGAVESL